MIITHNSIVLAIHVPKITKFDEVLTKTSWEIFLVHLYVNLVSLRENVLCISQAGGVVYAGPG